MGFLDVLRGLPTWARELPPHLRPSPDQIRRLEPIRVELGADHSNFLMHIAGHPETTRKVQRYFYDQLRRQKPDASEQDILGYLIVSRLTAAMGQGNDMFGLATAAGDTEKMLGRINEIIARHGSLDLLVDAMIEDDARRYKSVPGPPGSEEAAQRVTEILRER